MAQHGYLGDGYGMRGDHGDEDFGRDRGQNRERSFGDRDRERGFGERDRNFRDHDRSRDRNFMFDDDRQQSRSRDDWNDGRREREGWGGDPGRMSGRREQDDDHGFMDRAREKAQGWFGDDDKDHHGRQQDRSWGGQGRHEERPSLGGSGNHTGWENMQRSRPTPHRDDHYRSWREKQMQALDREYEEYCRDCEQKFHQDFDSWRQNRQQQGQSSPTSEQGGQDSSEQAMMSHNRPTTERPMPGTDPNGGGGTDFIGGAEVGVGGLPGQGATSVGAGSELAGAAGSMINEGTGGGGSGRKTPV
jgi:hypothetical protein